MEEKQAECNPFSFLIDSFWATLPEKTADDLATFKKDVLKGFKESVDSFIENELRRTDVHLENARRMREQYRKEEEESETPPPSPA
jgi:hypothetical protein